MDPHPTHEKLTLIPPPPTTTDPTALPIPPKKCGFDPPLYPPSGEKLRTIGCARLPSPQELLEFHLCRRVDVPVDFEEEAFDESREEGDVGRSDVFTD